MPADLRTFLEAKDSPGGFLYVLHHRGEQFGVTEAEARRISLLTGPAIVTPCCCPPDDSAFAAVTSRGQAPG